MVLKFADKYKEIVKTYFHMYRHQYNYYKITTKYGNYFRQNEQLIPPFPYIDLVVVVSIKI